MKTLLLIDANSLIHRFFHALPPLTTPDGEAIQAIYGLSGVLLKIIKDQKPDYVVAAFDRPEKTFRAEKFPAYKAHRPPAVDELVEQLKEARDVFAKFNIKVLEKPGFEADDIIGTLAEKFKQSPELADGKVVILSGDLDMLQLVEGEKVVVDIIKTGITNKILYDEKAVMERYNLKPSQLMDYKGLVGDTSDNIPGVRGVGPKTATELLRDFGTVEEVFDSITIIVPKTARKLQGNEEIAKLSKELATIKRDVDLDVSKLDELAIQDLDKKELTNYFSALGFKTLVERVQSL